jgi:hypothetical protein
LVAQKLRQASCAPRFAEQTQYCGMFLTPTLRNTPGVLP